MTKVNVSSSLSFLPQHWLSGRVGDLRDAHAMLQEGRGPGSDYMGWVNLPENYDKAEYARIKAAAARIQSDSEALVVIGIGGSYLGARAVVELLGGCNYNLTRKGTPAIYFAGCGLSPDALLETIELVKDKDLSLIHI